MKKLLFMSAFIVTNLLYASDLDLNVDIGLGIGTIDNDTKPIIFKAEKRLNDYISADIKLANKYFKTSISSNQFFIDKDVAFFVTTGFEQFTVKETKIKTFIQIQANESQDQATTTLIKEKQTTHDIKTQIFLQYNFLINLYKNEILPKFALQIGTQSININAGTFLNLNNKLNIEFEVEKRWLYKDDYKNTTSAAIYLNYPF